MNAPRINLHIERLVLNGVAPADRDTLAAALQRQLRKSLAQLPQLDALAGMRSVERLRLPALSLPANPSPHRLGTAAGRAIAEGIRQ